MSEIENLKIGNGGTLHIVGNEDIIANEWEAGQVYIENRSYVIREHKLLMCNTTHTSVEPFDPDKWTEKNIGEALGTAGSANMIECTLAEYNAWKAGGQLINETVYVITDAPNLNATAQQISYDGGTDSVYDVVEEHGIFPTALTLSDVGSNVSTNGSSAIKLSDKLILIYFDYVCSSASTAWVSLFEITYANSINNCWGIVVDSTNSFVAYTQAYYDSGKIKVRVQGCNTNATRGQMLIVTA